MHLSISVYPSINLSVYLSNHLSICRSICLYHSIYLSIHLYIYPSIYPSIVLSDFASVCPSICLFLPVCLNLSICLSICQSVYLSIDVSCFLSVCLSVCLSACVYLAICLPLCLSVLLSDFLCLYIVISISVFLYLFISFYTCLVCQSVNLSLCRSIYLSLSAHLSNLSIFESICRSIMVYLSTCLHVCIHRSIQISFSHFLYLYPCISIWEWIGACFFPYNCVLWECCPRLTDSFPGLILSGGPYDMDPTFSATLCFQRMSMFPKGSDSSLHSNIKSAKQFVKKVSREPPWYWMVGILWVVLNMRTFQRSMCLFQKALLVYNCFVLACLAPSSKEGQWFHQRSRRKMLRKKHIDFWEGHREKNTDRKENKRKKKEPKGRVKWRKNKDKTNKRKTWSNVEKAHCSKILNLSTHEPNRRIRTVELSNGSNVLIYILYVLKKIHNTWHSSKPPCSRQDFLRTSSLLTACPLFVGWGIFANQFPTLSIIIDLSVCLCPCLCLCLSISLFVYCVLCRTPLGTSWWSWARTLRAKSRSYFFCGSRRAPNRADAAEKCCDSGCLVGREASEFLRTLSDTRWPALPIEASAIFPEPSGAMWDNVRWAKDGDKSDAKCKGWCHSARCWFIHCNSLCLTRHDSKGPRSHTSHRSWSLGSGPHGSQRFLHMCDQQQPTKTDPIELKFAPEIGPEETCFKSQRAKLQASENKFAGCSLVCLFLRRNDRNVRGFPVCLNSNRFQMISIYSIKLTHHDKG